MVTRSRTWTRSTRSPTGVSHRPSGITRHHGVRCRPRGRPHAAGDPVINVHDEGDPTADEELFLVLQGHAVFELDGDRVDAPAGSSSSPLPASSGRRSPRRQGRRSSRSEARRERRTRPRLGALGAVRPALRDGRVRRGRRPPARSGRSRSQYALLFYNLACCESLSGRTTDALDHLRHAIELSEEFRMFAKDDSDFDAIRDDPIFKELTSS